jgi:hypothetical protein
MNPISTRVLNTRQIIRIIIPDKSIKISIIICIRSSSNRRQSATITEVIAMIPIAITILSQARSTSHNLSSTRSSNNININHINKPNGTNTTIKCVNKISYILNPMNPRLRLNSNTRVSK